MATFLINTARKTIISDNKRKFDNKQKKLVTIKILPCCKDSSKVGEVTDSVPPIPSLPPAPYPEFKFKKKSSIVLI